MKSFDVKTCRSKLAEHYERTAKVPTSVWSSVCQVELDQIYTRLSWVKKEQTPAGPSQSELTHYSDLFSANKNGVVPKRILVQGQTGIGKSTFVKKLSVDWAELDDEKTGDEQAATLKKFENNEGGEDVIEARNKEGIQDDKGMLNEDEDPPGNQSDVLRKFDLVLVVTLKEVSSCETLREVIRRSRLFPKDEEISTDDLLSYVRNNQEKVLLVFDGYDEYRTGSKAEGKFGSRSNSPICEIFHGNYLRGCTVLVTSRSSRADELQGSADKHAEITGFDEEDRKAFMRKMIDNESEVDQLLEFLGEEDMEDVARVPLLNLFFCLLWRLEKEKFMELVKRKTKLYRALIRHILQYGHKKHFPDQVSKVKEENYDEILDEIGKVALESILKGNQVFEYVRLSEKVRGEQSFIVGLLQLSEYGASLEPKEMVSFIHKSIQEYLAAWYITNKCVSDDNLDEIEEHACTLEDCEALENVFLFICGLSNKGAVKVFQHLSTVRVSDPSLDLSKIIPDKESETYVPLCDVTERHERFNYLVLNCVREVSSEAELVKHWFNCTGGIVYLTRPLGPELLPKPQRLIEAEHSWAFYFPHFGYNWWCFTNTQVSSLYKSVRFLNLFHIPLRITESSEVLKLEDFLTKFLNIECREKCLFSSVLRCRDGQIQCYITSLVLVCDAHVRVFTEAAVNQSLSAISLQSQSLSANMCSNQSCLKFLTSLKCGKRHDGELMKDLGAMIRNCTFLQRIILSGSSDYACGVLEQVANPGPCNLLISDYHFGTSFEAEKFAALLPRFPNVSTLNLDFGGCCAEAVTKLLTSITHNTLEKLSLREISFTSAAAAALGRALPEMTSLGSLELTGKKGSILQAEEIEALFGRFNKVLCLDTLVFKRFHVRGSLAPLTKSFRFFPKLTCLFLEKLDMDRVGLCLLLDSFQFIPNMRVLKLTGNPLGNAVTSIVPHLINLPELNLLFIGNTGCSEEDENYVREAAKAVGVRLMFL